jgi:hypothetical protein
VTIQDHQTAELDLNQERGEPNLFDYAKKRCAAQSRRAVSETVAIVVGDR